MPFGGHRVLLPIVRPVRHVTPLCGVVVGDVLWVEFAQSVSLRDGIQGVVPLLPVGSAVLRLPIDWPFSFIQNSHPLTAFWPVMRRAA